MHTLGIIIVCKTVGIYIVIHFLNTVQNRVSGSVGSRVARGNFQKVTTDVLKN